MENKTVTYIDDWSRTLRQRNTVDTPRAIRTERYETAIVIANASCEIERLERQREKLFEDLETLTYSFDGRAKMRELR